MPQTVHTTKVKSLGEAYKDVMKSMRVLSLEGIPKKGALVTLLVLLRGLLEERNSSHHENVCFDILGQTEGQHHAASTFYLQKCKLNKKGYFPCLRVNCRCFIIELKNRLIE